MIKQAKAGKPIDMDAVPPPVATGATQPTASTFSQPIPSTAAVEDLGTSNKATKLELTTQDGISKSFQDGKLCIERCFEVKCILDVNVSLLIKLRYFVESLYSCTSRVSLI